MVKRSRLGKKSKRARLDEGGGAYWEKEEVDTFSSGCALLDCSLGGGWAESRVINIVGDKSTGKTLLAIEASANFVRAHPDGKVRYAEVEAAFDESYAVGLGLPLDRVSFPGDEEEDDEEGINTVEDLFEDLERWLKKSRSEDVPVLYVLDSLDALSDRKEMESKMDEGTYGVGKAKRMSQLFRRVVRDMKKANLTLIVVSQIRTNLNATFGKQTTRSGGRALDFFASQILELAHLGQIKKTRKKVERVVGIKVRTNVTKCKIGEPFRKVEFPLLFNFGIEDLGACLEWLVKVDRWGEFFDTKKAAQGYLHKIPTMDDEDYFADLKRARKAVREVWREIEREFRPARRKYN